MPRILDDPLSSNEMLLLEESLMLERIRRRKAEQTLQTIASAKNSSAEQLRRVAIEYLEAA